MVTRKRPQPPPRRPKRLENTKLSETDRTSLDKSDADAAGDASVDFELRQHCEALFGEPTPWRQGLTESEFEGLDGLVRVDLLFAAFFFGRFREGLLDEYDKSLWSALMRLAVLRAAVENRPRREQLNALKRALAVAMRDIKLPPSPVAVPNSTDRMRPSRGAVYWREFRDDRGDRHHTMLSYGTPLLRRGRPQKTEEYQSVRQRIASRYESLVEPVEQVLITTGAEQRADQRTRLGSDDARRFSKAEHELREEGISLTPGRVATRMLSIEIQERLGGKRLSEWAIKKLRPRKPRRSGPSGLRGK
jgi:hypothetical protein